MLIGEATLKTASYCRRLTMLLDELRAAGCTVWLEGLRLRFDLPSKQSDDAQLSYWQAARFERMLACYSDIVSWVPLRDLEPTLLDKLTLPAKQMRPFWLRRPRAVPVIHPAHD